MHAIFLLVLYWFKTHVQYIMAYPCTSSSPTGKYIPYSTSLLFGSYLYYMKRCIYAKAYDDVIKWRHFPRYWPFVWGIHRWPVNSPHKCQWRGAFGFSLICVWINGWVNNGKAGDLIRHRAHYDVIVLSYKYGSDHFHDFLLSLRIYGNFEHCHCSVLCHFFLLDRIIKGCTLL